MGRLKIYWGVSLVVCGCASSPKQPESADLILPAWTKPPEERPTQHRTQVLEQKPGELIGDAPANARIMRTKKRPDNFTKSNDSRIYGGCGALNGAKCP